MIKRHKKFARFKTSYSQISSIILRTPQGFCCFEQLEIITVRIIYVDIITLTFFQSNWIFPRVYTLRRCDTSRERFNDSVRYRAYSRETIGAVEYVVRDRLPGVGHVAVQHVADDAEPLEHVHAAADVHVGRGGRRGR